MHRHTLPRSDNALEFWVRLALGLILLAASVDKILHPAAFARAVHNYQFLPDLLVNAVALVLPWLEAVLGCLLLAGVLLPGAVLVSTVLLAVFTGALGYNLARGLNVSCGCFSASVGSDPATLWTLARDLLFLGLGVFLFWRTFFVNPATKQ